MLEQLLAQLKSLLGMNDAVPMVGPGVVVLDGVPVDVLEPIRADWEPSHELRVFASQGKPGYEPSNAVQGGVRLLNDRGEFPPLRKDGYPLQYGIGRDPFGKSVISTRMEPWLKFADQTFPNAKAIDAYKAKRRKR